MGKHKPQLVTRKTREPVKHSFTNEEIIERAKRLSLATRSLAEIMQESKKVAASYKAKITEAESSVTVVSTEINDGWETRTMDVIVSMNYPKAGRKTITRADTGEFVREASMDPDDLQMKLDDTHLLPETGHEDCDGEDKHIPDDDQD